MSQPMGSRFEEVRARMDVFLREWPDAEFGPAHVVLSDDNLEDYWIDVCLARIDARDFGWMDSPPPDDELRATAAFLRSLKDVPEDDRCPDRGVYGEA